MIDLSACMHGSVLEVQCWLPAPIQCWQGIPSGHIAGAVPATVFTWAPDLFIGVLFASLVEL